MDQEQGTFLFRNRWSNAHDVQVLLEGDFRAHPGTEGFATAFQLGLRAFGAAFIRGIDPRTKPHDMSALLVDGVAFHARTDTGAPQLFEAMPGGGYVVLDGGAKYRHLGLDSARRHLVVHFADRGGDSAPALLSTLDVLRARERHTYDWQIAPGTSQAGQPVQALEGDDEEGRRTFLLRSGDAWVKGWVLHPAGAGVHTADLLRVRARGADAELWVAMLVGRGTPPRGRIRGVGLDSVLDLEASGASVSYDRARQRIRIQRSTAGASTVKR